MLTEDSAILTIRHSLEKKFKEEVLRFLKGLPYTWAEKISQMQISGTPDILACIRGHFVAIELKAKRNAAVTRLQSYNLARISDAEGISILASPDNWHEIKPILEELSNAATLQNPKIKRIHDRATETLGGTPQESGGVHASKKAGQKRRIFTP